MQTSEKTEQLTFALVSFRRQVKPIPRDRTVQIKTERGSFSYSYAELPAIIDAIAKPLTDNGLAVSQETVTVAGSPAIVTRIFHTSGEWLEAGPLVLPAQDSPQSYGSALTYARRYALAAALGIAAESDDDAQATKPAKRRSGGESKKTTDGGSPDKGSPSDCKHPSWSQAPNKAAADRGIWVCDVCGYAEKKGKGKEEA